MLFTPTLFMPEAAGSGNLARSFNGSSDFANSVSQVPFLSTDPGQSVAFWFNVTSAPAAYAGMVLANNSSNGLGSNTNGPIFYAKSGDTVALYPQNWGGVFSASDPLALTYSLGTWAHLAVSATSDGAVVAYFNGSAIYNTTTGGIVTNTSAYMLLGNDPLTAGRFFDGALSDIAFWNVALTSGQVSSLASAQRANTESSGNLVAYWPITGASPEPDMSGNSNNMALTGTTTTTGPF